MSDILTLTQAAAFSACAGKILTWNTGNCGTVCWSFAVIDFISASAFDSSIQPIRAFAR